MVGQRSAETVGFDSVVLGQRSVRCLFHHLLGSVAGQAPREGWAAQQKSPAEALAEWWFIKVRTTRWTESDGLC
ncbi:hypothetical protein ACH4D3_19510 [Streptomyces sp. NPDC018026]|uniref:hypothetical protein n=1 Tax=Streptomyces sp. NPDC018026 TaxID=3365031 RepID=UPI0037AF6889